MCKVKSGAMVTNNEDIRNMITRIILRQQNPYKKENILDSVKYYMRGSSVTASNAFLMKLINRSLDVFDRNDLVQCVNGYYYTRKIKNSAGI